MRMARLAVIHCGRSAKSSGLGTPPTSAKPVSDWDQLNLNRHNTTQPAKPFSQQPL